MNNTETNQTTTGNRPTHVVYHVRDRGEGRKGFWTRYGSMWAHGDGKGFSIQLNGLVPLDGRLTCRVWSEKKKESQQ